MISNMDNFAWYQKADMHEYAENWVAIQNCKVIAADDDLDKVLDQVEGKKGISVVRIHGGPICYAHW